MYATVCLHLACCPLQLLRVSCQACVLPLRSYGQCCAAVHMGLLKPSDAHAVRSGVQICTVRQI